MFPYEAGRYSWSYLYGQGGWEAVDAAYADVPSLPSRLCTPRGTRMTGRLRSSWMISPHPRRWLEEIDRGVMGEWYTYLILAKGIDSAFRLDEDTAARPLRGGRGCVCCLLPCADAETVFCVELRMGDAR